MCALGPRSVRRTGLFTGRRRRPAGARPQWRRQVLAPAHHCRPGADRGRPARLRGRRVRSHAARAGPLCGTPRRRKAGPDGPRESCLLGAIPRRRDGRRSGRVARRRPGGPGAGQPCCPAGGLPVGRTAAAPVARPPAGRAAADLAARRTDLGAGHRHPGAAGRGHAGPSGRGRNHSRRHPWPDRSCRRQGTAARRGVAGRRGRMTAVTALLMRDMRLAVRLGGGAPIGVLFFLIVVTLVPFALGPDLALLRRIGPAILWLGALLASLLALDRLFAADHEDGSLDVIVMSHLPLELMVAVKALAHWLTTGLPLVIAVPVLALFLDLEPRAMGAVALTLLVGTPALTCIGAVGAALAVTLRRGGLLLAVLVLPLTVPVLIFGVAAANAAVVGPAPFGPPFTILCALSLMSFVVGPFAAAAALRHGLE